MNRSAPTIEELANNPIVRGAIESAWVESLSKDPINRHEEGGWIFLHVKTGEIIVVRSARGGKASIALEDPPLRHGEFLVGVFHTHPNPSAEGWDPGPSSDDRMIDDELGIPDIIRSDVGLHFSGPKRRRGGLKGKPGYP
jgi:hypothetical protein